MHLEICTCKEIGIHAVDTERGVRFFDADDGINGRELWGGWNLGTTLLGDMEQGDAID